MLFFIHLSVGRLHFIHRADWRSIGAGVAISYVFLDILPHLSSTQYTIRDVFGTGILNFLEHHSYVLALAGFLAYFGAAFDIKKGAASSTTSRAQSPMSVKVLIGALCVYYFLIGYLVGEQPDHRVEPVIIFAIAMAVHAVGVDHTIREIDPDRYDRFFRYLLGGATVAGWLLGTATNVADILFALVFSYVAGAIMIVAFVFELPAVATARSYGLLVAGSVGFSSLLLIYEAYSKVSLGS